MNTEKTLLIKAFGTTFLVYDMMIKTYRERFFFPEECIPDQDYSLNNAGRLFMSALIGCKLYTMIFHASTQRKFTEYSAILTNKRKKTRAS